MSLCLKKDIVALVTAQRRSKKLKDVEWLLRSSTVWQLERGGWGEIWHCDGLEKVHRDRWFISFSSVRRRKDQWRSQNRRERLFSCTGTYKPWSSLHVEGSKFYRATGQTTGWKSMTGGWTRRCCLWFRKPLGCKCQRLRKVSKAGGPSPLALLGLARLLGSLLTGPARVKS